MPRTHDLILLHRQALAGSDTQLPFHQIKPGHGFGDRMLDLEPRIHLHEVETLAAFFGDELDRAGADVTNRARRRDRRLADIEPPLAGETRRRRLFYDFLMPALDRAIALEQMDDVAASVAENLHLNMAGAFEIAFQQHCVIAESAFRLAPGAVESARELGRARDDAHAPPAAAGGCFYHYRKADALGLGE